MYSIKQFFAAVLILGGANSPVLANDNSDMEVKSVQDVVEAFRTAVIEKDEPAFVELFYQKGIPWIGVQGAKRKGMLPSNSGVYSGSYGGFIGWIVSTEEQLEEKFWDVNIHTDGDIATVHFKYSFHEGDYKSNWGDESWQLIKTAEGWKIVSVTYSIEKNPEPKPKKKA